MPSSPADSQHAPEAPADAPPNAGHAGASGAPVADHSAMTRAEVPSPAARRMQHANILASSARSLALNVAPASMYADIWRIARGELGADGVAVYRADPDTLHASLAFSGGRGARVAELALPRFWDATGGVAVREGRPAFLATAGEERDPEIASVIREAAIASLAILPLLVEGRPQGLLILRYEHPQTFDPDQRQLLIDFGAHAAVALRNSLLFADLERRAARLAAVTQVQQAISAAVALDQLYAAVYHAVSSVVDAPCFALLSWDPREQTFVPDYLVNDGEAIDTAPIPHFALGEGATSQAFRAAAPNVAARTRLGWTGQSYEVEGEGSIAVVLSAPIVHGDQVLGVLQAQSYRQDAYDWDDVDLIMLIARQAGTAIVNARAFEAERREREQAAAAAAIARVALNARSVAEAAGPLLTVAAGVTGAQTLVLALADDTGDISVVASRGDAPALENTGLTLGELLQTPTAAAHARLPGGETAFVVRLASGDRTLGLLIVRDPRPDHPPAAREREALLRLADPIALALDTLLLREEERRQQERQRIMATALETLEQPVFVYAADGTIQYANGAAVREYRFRRDELIGMPGDRLAVSSLTTGDKRFLTRELRTKGVWAGERVARRKDGTEFPAWVILSAIRGPGGRLRGQVGITRNLAEERRVAEQLRQSEKLAALGELVAGVAHEINNPLTGISMLAQLLAEPSEKLTTEQAESVRGIKREADRAVAVVRDLLTFARKSGPRIVEVELNELIEQTIRLRAYGLRTAGVNIELELAPDLHRVRGDDRQLQQVLLNLVVNAEHAMSGARVRRLGVRTGNEADRVVLELSDSGVGMSPEVQQRIFEPFFTTKPEGRGTGLGLSVSYGIVQTHRGTLTVRSAPGEGSTFRLSLPAYASETDTSNSSTS